MNREAFNYPSNMPYQGPIKDIGKEVLKKIINEIKNLSTEELITKINGYSKVSLGKGITQENTFEMVALYQKALSLLGYTLSIDGHFGRELYYTLKNTAQAQLGITGNDVDGFPGPKTTDALIKKLQKITEGNTQKEKINTEVKAIQEQLKNNNNQIRAISQNGNIFIGKDITQIDYASIKQSDGTTLLYDRIIGNSRYIYYIDTQGKIVGKISIDANGKISGDEKDINKIPKNIPFLPKFIIKTK